MDILGTSVLLQGSSGRISDGGSSTKVLALAIKRTLVGSLTITGLANSDGSAYGNWTLAAGTTAGCYAAPGSGASGGNPMFYALSDSADDAGAAVIAFQRIP